MSLDQNQLQEKFGILRVKIGNQQCPYCQRSRLLKPDNASVSSDDPNLMRLTCPDCGYVLLFDPSKLQNPS
jgi:transposase-like protein